MNTDITAIKPERAPISSIQPTREQDKHVENSIIHLGFRSAFLNAYYYNQLKLVFTLDVPLAATDQHCVYLNPVAIMEKGWTIKNVTFVIAHEICHAAYDHLVMSAIWRAAGKVKVPDGRLLDYDHDLMNCAMDYGINAGLVDSAIGEMPPEGLLDLSISRNGQESCLELYAKLWDKQKRGGKPPPGGGQPCKDGQPGPGQGRKGIPQPGQPGGGFDEHMEPAKKAVDASKTGEHDQAVVSAANISEMSKGTLPGMFKKLLGDILEPVVPWQEHMKTSMMRASGDPIIDWRYFDRRLMQRSPREFFGKQSHTRCWLHRAGSAIRQARWCVNTTGSSPR